MVPEQEARQTLAFCRMESQGWKMKANDMEPTTLSATFFLTQESHAGPSFIQMLVWVNIKISVQKKIKDGEFVVLLAAGRPRCAG